MDKPLDEYLLALSGWQYVAYVRGLFLLLFVIGALGFLFYWFVALKIWISGLLDSWRNNRGFSWTRDLSNPIAQQFLKALLKAFLIWLIAFWPLIATVVGLASDEAFNALLG